jgi:hypothetical protein
MTVPAPPTLTPAPSPAPTRTDPANFNVRADAYHSWLVPHVNTELPAVFTWMTARQNDVVGLVEDAEDQVALAANQVTLASNQVALAANQVTLAESAAAAASAAANASIWVSGQTYAIGVVRFSPINFLSYRRKTAGAGTTDPSLDATNWAQVAGTGDVTLTGIQTLTNKTLTNPVINGITGDSSVINFGSGQFYKDASGNVGIGTSSPDAKLTVNGAASFAAGTALLPSIARSGDLNTGFWFPAADTIAASTAGTECARITSSGDVGIGSATVGGRVTSTVNFGNGPTASNFTAQALGTAQGQLAGYSFRPTFQGTSDNGPRRAADISSGFNGSTWGTEFLAFGVGRGGAANDAADATIERLRITGAGNVGIGTSSPDAKLTVNGAASFAAGTALLPSIARSGDLNTGFWFPAADTIAASTAGSERMRIDSSGNVLVTGGGALGYGTGSGGTVTQATSKTTDVTLNKTVGRVVMNNSALAANSTVQFQLNNSFIGLHDTLVLSLQFDTGSNGYTAFAYCGTGLARIFVRNNTGGAMSEAVAINFAIIKGAIS